MFRLASNRAIFMQNKKNKIHNIFVRFSSSTWLLMLIPQIIYTWNMQQLNCKSLQWILENMKFKLFFFRSSFCRMEKQKSQAEIIFDSFRKVINSIIISHQYYSCNNLKLFANSKYQIITQLKRDFILF